MTRIRTGAAALAVLMLHLTAAAQTPAGVEATGSRDVKPPVVRLSHATLKRRAVTCKVPTYVQHMPLRRMTPAGVEILIDERGRVRSAVAVSGHPLLRASAVQAAWRWTFRPFRVKGRRVTAAGVLTLFFSSDAAEMERQCEALRRAP